MALQTQVRRVVAAIDAVSSNAPLISTESVQPEVQYQPGTLNPHAVRNALHSTLRARNQAMLTFLVFARCQV
jgi:hypothetical protein